MTTQWIRRDGTPSLTLLFLGWGTDANAIAALGTPPADMLAVYDYTAIEPLSGIDGYKSINIVGWSMGVFAAECWLQSHPQANATLMLAINGTGRPVDDAFGIPTATVQATLDNWSEAARTKFNMRMCGGRSAYSALTALMPQRGIENQRDELQAIMQRAQSHTPMHWQHAIIGTADLIFAPEAQQRHWAQYADATTTKPWAHFPFAGNSWNEISIW